MKLKIRSKLNNLDQVNMRLNDLSIFLSKFLTMVHITTSVEGFFTCLFATVLFEIVYQLEEQ